MKILYITYIPFGEAASGSSVRPQRMYKALLEPGHEIKLLSGEQGRGDRKNRACAVREIRNWLKTNRPDLCYIESPTYPIMFHCDRKLIRDLHKMGIPTGYFYRDCYRRFPDLFPRRKDFVGRLKECYLGMLQRLTDRVLQNVDIIYTPSQEFAEAFPEFRDKRPLPPAGENCFPVEKPFSKTCIYVGGITSHYGGELLLDAFTELNSGAETYSLLLVCRKAEWDRFSHPAKDAAWLEVHHAQGEALEPLYAKASVAALIPRADNAYNDFAISVKLFEYMGHGLPIIATKSSAMGRLMENYGLGICTPYDAKAYAAAMKALLEDRAAYADCCARVKKALLTENLWEHRVASIIADLIDTGNK